jgi:hypothetical protein
VLASQCKDQKQDEKKKKKEPNTRKKRQNKATSIIYTTLKLQSRQQLCSAKNDVLNTLDILIIKRVLFYNMIRRNSFGSKYVNFSANYISN